MLTVFNDLSEDSLTAFMGRDLQYRHEAALREEREKTGEKGTSLVGPTLLLSDAIVALSGRPTILPTPLTGYPYESIQDMMERGGVKELPFSIDAFADTVAILHAVGVGAKACAEYYREHTERLEEAVEPVLAQLRQLLAEGYTLDGLRKDANWSTWIDFFEARGALGASN